MDIYCKVCNARFGSPLQDYGHLCGEFLCKRCFNWAFDLFYKFSKKKK